MVAGAAVLAVMSPPAVGRRGTRVLDAAIVITLLAIALQLLPLAPAIHDAVTPGAVAFDRQMLVGAASAATAQPISLNPAATTVALILDVALAIIFWSTQQALRHGGQRWLARTIATLGLLLAPFCVIHHLRIVPALDGLWPVTRRDLRPWGPFVSRNDFAGWMAMATALTLGYLVARLEAHHRDNEAFDADRAFDETGTRLAAALCVMTGGIMISLSRSGLAGVGVGLAVFLIAGRGRIKPRRRNILTLMLVLLIAGGAVFANLGALSSRLETALSEGMTGRASIWSQTLPVVRDFWPVGAGVGAYARVMILYQTSTRLMTVVHADNEPLQIAAEGGLLVGLPVALLVVGLVLTLVRRLREDRTRVFWIRLGAVCGLAAIVTQNLVEMTLRVPATGLLAVVLAAIAVHERS